MSASLSGTPVTPASTVVTHARPASTSPVVGQPGNPTMILTGTLRQRGPDYFLEEQPDQQTGDRTRWAMPRIYRLDATALSQADVRARIDAAVTVTGRPSYLAARDRMVIMLDSMEPHGRSANGN